MRRVFSYCLLVHGNCNTGNKEVFMGAFPGVATGGKSFSSQFNIGRHHSAAAICQPMDSMSGTHFEVSPWQK